MESDILNMVKRGRSQLDNDEVGYIELLVLIDLPSVDIFRSLFNVVTNSFDKGLLSFKDSKWYTKNELRSPPYLIRRRDSKVQMFTVPHEESIAWRTETAIAPNTSVHCKVVQRVNKSTVSPKIVPVTSCIRSYNYGFRHNNTKYRFSYTWRGTSPTEVDQQQQDDRSMTDTCKYTLQISHHSQHTFLKSIPSQTNSDSYIVKSMMMKVIELKKLIQQIDTE